MIYFKAINLLKQNKMKKILITFSALLLINSLNAQAPQKMSYQSVIRNTSNALLSNTNVGIQVSILQGSSTGVASYIERHTTLTNQNGLATIEIGNGTVIAGNFSGIDWSNGPYFIKTETDPNGGTTYSISATSQLLSVPYALYAENSGSSVPGPQGPAGPQGPVGPTGPAGPDQQTLSFSGTTLSISGGNSVNLNSLVNDADANPSNEIQSLTLVGSTLSISGGNSVTLPSGGAGGTLDQSYDFGGAGLGRSITTDAGAVQINNSGSNTTGLEVNSAVNNSTAVLANVSGVGVGFRAESTNSSNSFAAIQANTNSSNANNSAILGNNSGSGYGVSGQIPSTASGAAAVYGSNLRASGGYGVQGIGFNGVVGQSQNAQGFGVYGVNNNAATGTAPSLGIGTYGLGFNGVYGQTNNTSIGWAGYFTFDLGVEGTGYALGGWVNASDRRLKSNIQPIGSALSKINQINGVHYTITTKSKALDGEVKISSKEQYGVIAQDVEKVFPEMVKEKALFINAGDETQYKTVDYIQLVPVLLEAIKELQIEVETLKQQVETLKEIKE